MSITSKRIWANVIDGIFVVGPFYIFFYFICKRYQIDTTSLTALFLEGLLLNIFISLYFGILESSKWQASIGKKMMGFILCDAEGNRLSFWVCFARAYVFQLIWSAMVIYALVTNKKELLHDKAFDHTKVIEIQK